MQFNYCLDDYSISLKEAALFCVVSPYAKRHKQLYYCNREFKPHNRLAIVESIPIIGALASLAEVIFVKINDCFAFRKRELTTPDLDEKFNQRVEKIVTTKIPNFYELSPQEQLSALSEAAAQYSLPEKETDRNSLYTSYYKKMLLLWKFSKVSEQIVDEAAQQSELPGDIKTKRARIYADQQGTPRVYRNFFAIPEAYAQAREFQIAINDQDGNLFGTTALMATQYGKWKYTLSKDFYTQGKAMEIRRIYNAYCRNARDQYDYNSFLVNSGRNNDDRFDLHTREDKGTWTSPGTSPS